MVTIPPDNWLYGSISIENWQYSFLSPPDNWLYSSLSPRQLLNGSPIIENLLFSSISSNIGYIVTVPTENCSYGSIQLKTDYCKTLFIREDFIFA